MSDRFMRRRAAAITSIPRWFTLGPAMLLAATLAVTPLVAQTKYPHVDSVYPVCVSLGSTSDLTIETNGNVKSAHKALVADGDIAAEVLPRDAEKKLPDGHARVRVTVGRAAALGPHDLRLVTKESITTVARFYVTHLPTTVETSDHGSQEKAQEISIEGAVTGRIGGAVEIDWYRFHARRGDRINFNLIGTRLHETICKVGRFTPHFDAHLTLYDGTGREVATGDDHYFADPLLSHEFDADGEYRLAVRDANYKGHRSYTYTILATRGPYAQITLPLVAVPGESTSVEVIGPGYGPGSRARIKLPLRAVAGDTYLVTPLAADGTALNELSVIAARLPAAQEAEPGGNVNDAIENAQPINLPAGVAGRLAIDADVDTYAFRATAGTTYRFEVYARRLFSRLDAVLSVLDADGKRLATGDDAKDLAGRPIKDPVVVWKAPADGTYFLQLRDLHQRGGADSVYQLECSVDEQDFALSFDPELCMVGPGNRTPIYVRAHRRGGFNGQIDLEVEGLPKGVTATTTPIRAGMRDACLVFSVSPDAPTDGSIFRIRGRGTLKSSTGAESRVERRATPLVEIYQARRVVGRTGGIAVTAASDIEVTTPLTEIHLAPGETKYIDVELVRGSQYASGSVSLWGDWRFGRNVFGNSLPPGVVVNDKESRTGINGSDVEGRIALTAEADAAPITGVETVVIGLVPIEFSVFVPFCTPPIRVTVTDKQGRPTGPLAIVHRERRF